ncbi:hypothetical protein ALC60_11878 [Trachymyrmex zeteki]|uniref:Helix-turn-helix domain-containing protein n=1 Tax=Mycetomoellerius zeteki TaxID=64791 RepID=A0A151WLY6_9HYME|nr:hypothetical protein ALC60_11878 [Trachymyrmex zeteki]
MHSRIKFTLEVGGDKLNFLDITLIKNERIIESDWFHKPTLSGKFINFHSLHSLTQKKGVIIGMLDIRAVLLSQPKYHLKNIELIVATFLENDYSLEFIFSIINSRLKSFFHKDTSKQGNSDMEDETAKKSCFTVPYLSSISEKFKNITKDMNTSLYYCSLNKLDGIIKDHKDRLQVPTKMSCIQCRDCDATYVGQTGRLLKMRIKEHRNYINKKLPVNL